MPCRTAAGVFGMARTIRAPSPSSARMPPVLRPAMIEMNSVPGPASAAKAGSVADASCGLMARTTAPGR